MKCKEMGISDTEYKDFIKTALQNKAVQIMSDRSGAVTHVALSNCPNKSILEMLMEANCYTLVPSQYTDRNNHLLPELEQQQQSNSPEREREKATNKIADSIPYSRISSTPVLMGTHTAIKDQFTLPSPIVGPHEYSLGDEQAIKRNMLKLSPETGDSSGDSYSQLYSRRRKRRRCHVQNLVGEQPTQFSEPSRATIGRSDQSDGSMCRPRQSVESTPGVHHSQSSIATYIGEAGIIKNSFELRQSLALHDGLSLENGVAGNETAMIFPIIISSSSASSSTESLSDTDILLSKPTPQKSQSPPRSADKETLDIVESETVASSSTQSIDSFSTNGSLEFKISDLIRTNDSIYKEINSEIGGASCSDVDLSSLQKILDLTVDDIDVRYVKETPTDVEDTENIDVQSGKNIYIDMQDSKETYKEAQDDKETYIETQDDKETYVDKDDINDPDNHDKYVKDSYFEVQVVKDSNIDGSGEEVQDKISHVEICNDESGSSNLKDDKLFYSTEDSNSCEDLFNTADQSGSPTTVDTSRGLFDWSKISQLSTQQLAKRFDFHISDSDKSPE